MNTGKRIKLSREKIENILIEKGLSFKWLSTELGKGRSYVTDHFAPSRHGEFAISTALAISNLLDCCIDDMRDNGDVETKKKEIVKNDIESELQKLNVTMDCVLAALYSICDLYKQAWIDKVD